jgi:hypothetical protein
MVKFEIYLKKCGRPYLNPPPKIYHLILKHGEFLSGDFYVKVKLLAIGAGQADLCNHRL